MSTNSTIIKFSDAINRQHPVADIGLTKVQGSIDLESFVKLIKIADLQVNPRQAKMNSIASAIIETLRESPNLYFFKTKGLLLASRSVEYLERNRVRIAFNEPETEGVMDGGHNAIALAHFIISEILDKKVKTWPECKDIWENNYDEIISGISNHRSKSPEKFDILIPIEIIHPTTEDATSIADYEDNLVEICYSRNNNHQITEASLQNKAGAFNELKDAFNTYDIPISWKTGDGKRVKVEDIIALACIPLKYIVDEGLLEFIPKTPSNTTEDASHKQHKLETLNRVNIYNSKSKCVEFYKKVIDHTCEMSNGEYIVTSSIVKSALHMTPEITLLVDKIYCKFPEMYNNLGGSFGRISSVKSEQKSKGPFQSDGNLCKWSYPLAFIYPLIYGITSLISFNQETSELYWSRKPSDINLDSLPIDKYVELFKLAKFHPNTIGKSGSFYDMGLDVFKSL